MDKTHISNSHTILTHSLALARMPFWHQWSCRWCAWQTPSFVENTRFEAYMRGALKKHIRDHHTCQHCCAVGKGKAHEEACLRQRARKQAQKAKYMELKVAREAMLLICLAANSTKEAKKEAKAADQDPTPSPCTPCTPIATLTADALQCVFKHFVNVKD
jgi:hypothetical protein